MGLGAGCSSVGLAAGAGQLSHPAALPAAGSEPKAAGADGTWRGWAAAGLGQLQTCCHLLLLLPDPNLTPLPSSAPLQPCPSSFNCSHFISQPPAFVGVPDTLPQIFISPWLCGLCSPNNLRGAHKFFVQLQLGGCFSRMPWKNYLT